jgi:hypothetical protein
MRSAAARSATEPHPQTKAHELDNTAAMINEERLHLTQDEVAAFLESLTDLNSLR